jgi:multidrug transporter EmrE-like cation transporter
MSSGVMAAVLFAAVLHALWNSIVKSGDDKFAVTAVVCLWCGLIALCVALMAPIPAAAFWPFVAASAVTHVVYFALVGRLYRDADLSAAYPIMRGAAPLLTTTGAWLALGEGLDPAAAAGVALLVGGVL